MSTKLPNNKQDKRARYDMLVKQGSMSCEQADRAYKQYCKLYDVVKSQQDTGWQNTGK